MILLAAAVFVAAVALMATIAGWSDVATQLRRADPWWLPAAFVTEAVAFAGYVLAYRGVARIDNGPHLGLRESVPLVAVGFGVFLARGGKALDARALNPEPGAGREGEVRVLALDALEHAPLAPAAWTSAVVLLVQGRHKPGLDFTIPWATLVPIGTLLALWGVKHRQRYAGKEGWRGGLGKTLDGIYLLFRLLAEWRTRWDAFAGSAIYWAGDVACLWVAARIFYTRPSVPAVVLAHAVGYVLTRRTLPLAGAGIVEVLMPLTLAAAGVPFSAALAAVVVYRVFNLWLPLVPALAALPAAERILEQQDRADRPRASA